MKAFAALYSRLDATTSTEAKRAALVEYFTQAPAADAAWAAWFLAGGRLGALVRTRELRAVAQRAAGLSEWLFEACYQAVGDLAETIALLWPEPAVVAAPDHGLAHWVEAELLPLAALAPEARTERLRGLFDRLDEAGRFLLVKMIGGGFRVGVSRLMVERALAEVAGVDPKRIAERMMGYTDRARRPTAQAFEALVAPASSQVGDDATAPSGQPYPFFLAHPLQSDDAGLAQALGPREQWQVEWKFDGIRAQLVRRGEGVWLWSRGEELVTERFPEVVRVGRTLPPGTVLDGELLVGSAAAPASFALMQRRIGRKRLTARLLADIPVVFVAYDLLETEGVDRRDEPLRRRRERLEALLAEAPSGLELSPVLPPETGWSALASLRKESRARGVEGFMLKALDSRYGAGRTKATGLWWKWKVDPMSVDAVLVYAQAGHGRRANLYTDYTFAVWSRPPKNEAEVAQAVAAIERGEAPAPGALALVPFAKAYSGLTDQEFRDVDALIRRHTLNRFGPVRAVRPCLVFEIGFEGIAESSRHKSGIAVRFPRMLRIRHDKAIGEADTLGALTALLHAPSQMRAEAGST
ncbi:MAG: ATP-dependent DNA ligase [Casimicrobiaceae bacterium]